MEFILIKGEEEVTFTGFSTYNLCKIPGLADKLQNLYDDSENKYLVEYFISIVDYFLGYEINEHSTCSRILSMYTDVVFYGAISGVDPGIFKDIRPWLEYFLYACEEQTEAQELAIAPTKIKENTDNSPDEVKAAREELLSVLKTKIVNTKLV